MAKIGRAFWEGKALKGSSVHSTGDKLFSYGTVILQRLPDGHVIAKYSVTTSKHQNQVNINDAYVTIGEIPQGTSDLFDYLKNFNILEWEKIQEKTISLEKKQFIEKIQNLKNNKVGIVNVNK
jgi:hypothetical protein